QSERPTHTFSVQRCGDPRGLHSFPTRRSSDLAGAAYDAGERIFVDMDRKTRLLAEHDVETANQRTTARHHDPPVHDVARQLGRRSEEHTSELQSQSNLVCRLLLEKKKIKLRSI